MRITHVQLHTHCLDDQRRFYEKVLRLTAPSEAQCCVVEAGETRLEFVSTPDDSRPCYHFAFNIPENKLPEAKAWVSERCVLLKDSETQRDELFFPHWNAHSIYFHDAAHNVVELIARHSLDNATDESFSAQQILGVSEIGIVVDPEGEGRREIRSALGIQAYQGSSFAVGDETGLFILPREGRPWIPERTQPAAAFPTRVTVQGEKAQTFSFTVIDRPYEIVVENKQ